MIVDLCSQYRAHLIDAVQEAIVSIDRAEFIVDGVSTHPLNPVG